MLVQITPHHGVCRRVPWGQDPVIELQLREGQQVVRLDISDTKLTKPERSTVDYHWTAWVATSLR